MVQTIIKKVNRFFFFSDYISISDALWFYGFYTIVFLLFAINLIMYLSTF